MERSRYDCAAGKKRDGPHLTGVEGGCGGVVGFVPGAVHRAAEGAIRARCDGPARTAGAGAAAWSQTQRQHFGEDR